MSDGNSLLVDFSCNVTKVGSIDTPNFVTDAEAAQLVTQGKIAGLKKFSRKVFTSGKKTMPDGFELRHWGFAGESGGEPLPSPQIRLTEGTLAQVKMDASTSVHTIHHHGIEPDPFNDGVGHTSFEASGSYTYQWLASEPGSYWYHCHVNTVLHVQMGLFGTLVIDPAPLATDPPGTKRLFRGGPKYVHERYWVPYAADPRWHDLNHAAGLCGDDVGMNRFEPKYFGISGLFQKDGNNIPAVFDAPPISDESVAITAATGEPILIRLLNGQYFPINVEIDPVAPTVTPLLFQVVSSDGRPYLDSTDYSGRRGNGQPAAQVLPDDVPPGLPLITPAERYDLILNTPADEPGGPGPVPPGVYEVIVRFVHWISSDVVGVARTRIKITEAAAASAKPTIVLAAPTSVRRGDEFTVSATVTNPGTAPLDGLTSRLTWSGPLELRDDSAQKSVGSIAGGASKTVSWRLRGTDRGSATLTATLRNAAGSTLASASRAITVLD